MPVRSLSALQGGEGRGEGGAASAARMNPLAATTGGATHLTLPAARRRVPSLSPPKGGEGRVRIGAR